MLAVDVGGTFTDVVAVRDGLIQTAKVSTDYSAVYGSVVEGATTLGVEGSRVFNHASTHGLNAVITRNLPKIGVLLTEGHRDILDHGTVGRPGEALLDPNWRRSFGDAQRPLVERYLRRGIRERVLADGSTLFGLDEDQARSEIRILKRCGVTGVAIVLMNSYVNASHEQRLREIVLEELGEDVPVSISSDVSPLAQEYARASTTVIDTFMKLIFSDYIQKLDDGLRAEGFEGQLNFADCAATLVPAASAINQPFRIVFAGPAAGTVASAHFGAMIGEADLLCADVGGTSCDISVVRDGEPSLKTTFALEDDLVVNALANDVTAIGAGGGSLVTVGLSGEIQVGPGSAGSTPGPACYGKGGTQPTTTDTCLMAGIIDPGTFADGKIALDRELSRTAFEDLDCTFTLEERIRFAYEMGVQNLAEGIFNVAIKTGVDPREFSLVAYGAAGPMLLPATMDLVKCKQVIIPPHPGLFSALGLLSTEQKFAVSRSAYTMLTPDAAPTMNAIFDEMERSLTESLSEDVKVSITRSFDGRLAGQTYDTPFIQVPSGTIDADAVALMVSNFHDAFYAHTGNKFDLFPVEGVTYRVQAIVESEKVEYPILPARKEGTPLAPVRRTILRYLYDTDIEVPVYERTDLRAGDVIDGSAVISEKLSTTHICPGQRLTVGRYGELVITSV
ncbi:hydantoinase/oxoprolinase family protein [Rhodococcus erythropolis]|uniref:hydantoinase/oxoprolinase family protein n=1 Tax=Rhodococcus erythropolis TaxID=1833 RepID=UPI0037FA7226